MSMSDQQYINFDDLARVEKVLEPLAFFQRIGNKGFAAAEQPELMRKPMFQIMAEKRAEEETETETQCVWNYEIMKAHKERIAREREEATARRLEEANAPKLLSAESQEILDIENEIVELIGTLSSTVLWTRARNLVLPVVRLRMLAKNRDSQVNAIIHDHTVDEEGVAAFNEEYLKLQALGESACERQLNRAMSDMMNFYASPIDHEAELRVRAEAAWKFIRTCTFDIPELFMIAQAIDSRPPKRREGPAFKTQTSSSHFAQVVRVEAKTGRKVMFAPVESSVSFVAAVAVFSEPIPEPEPQSQPKSQRSVSKKMSDLIAIYEQS
jgi:hypothetical protein